MASHSAPAPSFFRRAALALAVTVGALGLALASLGTAQAFTHGDQATSNGVTTPQQQRVTMVDHGGAVQASVRVQVIWWGPAAGFPADQRTTVHHLLTSLDGSAYLATAEAYLRGAEAHVAYDPATDWTDATTPPSGATGDQVAAEVARFLAATGRAADSGTVYLVYSTAQAEGGDCAWHDARGITAHGVATLIDVAYLPQVSGQAQCSLGRTGPASADTLSVVSSTAHELVETMTDPVPGATWTDTTADADEVSDPCSSDIREVRLAGGVTLPLQTIWSNAAHGCTAG